MWGWEERGAEGGREMGQDAAMVWGCGVRERVGSVTKTRTWIE